MAATNFVAYSSPPGYIMLNSLKDSQHFADGSSCYCNSYHKTMLCLHWSLIHQALHVPQKKKSNGVKSGEQGGQVIGPPRPSHLLANISSKYSRTTLVKRVGRHHAGTTFHDGLPEAPLAATWVRFLGEMLGKCHQ
jgi:hypothetical protein